MENGFQEPANATTYNALSRVERDLFRDNMKKDAKSLFYIFQVVHESVFLRVAAATKSKKTWDTLQTTYQGMEKVKRTKLQMLRRDIETFCMTVTLFIRDRIRFIFDPFSTNSTLTLRH